MSASSQIRAIASRLAGDIRRLRNVRGVNACANVSYTQSLLSELSSRWGAFSTTPLSGFVTGNTSLLPNAVENMLEALFSLVGSEIRIISEAVGACQGLFPAANLPKLAQLVSRTGTNAQRLAYGQTLVLAVPKLEMFSQNLNSVPERTSFRENAIARLDRLNDQARSFAYDFDPDHILMSGESIIGKRLDGRAVDLEFRNNRGNQNLVPSFGLVSVQDYANPTDYNVTVLDSQRLLITTGSNPPAEIPLTDVLNIHAVLDLSLSSIPALWVPLANGPIANPFRLEDIPNNVFISEAVVTSDYFSKTDAHHAHYTPRFESDGINMHISGLPADGHFLLEFHSYTPTDVRGAQGIDNVIPGTKLRNVIGTDVTTFMDLHYGAEVSRAVEMIVYANRGRAGDGFFKALEDAYKNVKLTGEPSQLSPDAIYPGFYFSTISGLSKLTLTKLYYTWYSWVSTVGASLAVDPAVLFSLDAE